MHEHTYTHKQHQHSRSHGIVCPWACKWHSLCKCIQIRTDHLRIQAGEKKTKRIKFKWTRGKERRRMLGRTCMGISEVTLYTLNTCGQQKNISQPFFFFAEEKKWVASWINLKTLWNYAAVMFKQKLEWEADWTLRLIQFIKKFLEPFFDWCRRLFQMNTLCARILQWWSKCYLCYAKF